MWKSSTLSITVQYFPVWSAIYWECFNWLLSRKFKILTKLFMDGINSQNSWWIHISNISVSWTFLPSLNCYWLRRKVLTDQFLATKDWTLDKAFYGRFTLLKLLIKLYIKNFNRLNFLSQFQLQLIGKESFDWWSFLSRKFEYLTKLFMDGLNSKNSWWNFQ